MFVIHSKIRLISTSRQINNFQTHNIHPSFHFLDLVDICVFVGSIFTSTFNYVVKFFNSFFIYLAIRDYFFVFSEPYTCYFFILKPLSWDCLCFCCFCCLFYYFCFFFSAFFSLDNYSLFLFFYYFICYFLSSTPYLRDIFYFSYLNYFVNY